MISEIQSTIRPKRAEPRFRALRSLETALVVWLIMIGVEAVHGLLRTTFLVPVVGDFRARQIGMFIGSALILLVAYVFVDWLHAPDRKSLMLVGLLWLALTVAFEIGFGHFVLWRSWESFANEYNLVRGGLLPFGPVVVVFSPLIATWLRKLNRQRPGWSSDNLLG